MCQTLFIIPRQIGGVDVFGFGWLSGLWAVASAIVLGWSFRRHGWSPQARGYLPVLAILGVFIAVVLPQLMEPEGMPIRGYGVMLLVAVVASVALGLYRARQVGVDPEIMLSLATWLFVAGIVGARLFYIIEYWHKFQKPTLGETLGSMLNLTQGGLVVYGSMLAGGAALVAFVYKYHLPGLALADLIAPSVVLGVGLGRIGCFLNGCCYGGITDVSWAVRFPEGSPPFVDQVQSGKLYLHGMLFRGSGEDPPVLAEVEPGSPAAREGLKAGDRLTQINGARVSSVEAAQFELMRAFGAGTRLSVGAGDADERSWAIEGPPPRSRPVHPTQLYSLIDALLLCFVLLAYEPFRRRDGELTALVLTIHPISRFLLEIIRIDESAVFNTGMSISQNISIAIFIGGILLWLYLLWGRKPGCVWSAPAESQQRFAVAT